MEIKKLKISKWIIFEDSLFLLFYPFLIFDIFVFYDDGANDFLLIGVLWLLIFAVALLFYLIQRWRARGEVRPLEVAELLFFSFEVLFFTANAFMIGLFAYIVLTNRPYLIWNG